MRKYCFHFSLLFSYDTFFNQTCNCTVEPIFLFVCEQTEGNVSWMSLFQSFLRMLMVTGESLRSLLVWIFPSAQKYSLDEDKHLIPIKQEPMQY